MLRRDIPDHQHLIAHHEAAPTGQKTLPAARPARCTARTYGGELVTVDGEVTSRAGHLLAFRADYPCWGWWTAWVDAGCCEPL